MNVSSILFYAISSFVLGSALLAVTSLRIFRSAVWLLLSLIGIAGLYFWLQVEFIAAAQIIIYVGGIVVLIIFSIFLTQESGTKMPRPGLKQIILSVCAALLGFAGTTNLIVKYRFPAISTIKLNASVSEIGMQMLSTSAPGFLLPFELVSMLLLAAMIGCIVIAMKPGDPAQPVEKGTLTNVPKDTPGPTDERTEQIVKPILIAEEIENE